MPPLLEHLLVAALVAAAAVYASWTVMPQSWRLRLVTRLAVLPPTAAPAARLLQRWRAAQGCAGCAAAGAAPVARRTPLGSMTAPVLLLGSVMAAPSADAVQVLARFEPR